MVTPLMPIVAALKVLFLQFIYFFTISLVFWLHMLIQVYFYSYGLKLLVLVLEYYFIGNLVLPSQYIKKRVHENIT